MITLKNLTVKYQKQTVIKNLNFTFENGKIYGITGASGIGKTTLINAISGLVPSRGEIISDEQKYAYIFQDSRLFPWLTALQNVECVCKDTQRASYFLGLLLPDGMEKYPHELSGGMKQRVSIARALAYDAPLMLLDEPFKGLDIETKQQTVDIVLKQLEGRTAILVSHDESELALCDEVYKAEDSPITHLIRQYTVPKKWQLQK